jgi:hypothetical protein
MKTKISRDLRGAWQGQSFVPLENNRAVRLSTLKTHSGAIVSSATVVTMETMGFVYQPFSDYHKRLIVSNVRATEKAVMDQHEKALAMLDEIKAEIAAFYAKKDAA